MHLHKTIPLSAALLAIAMPSLHAQLFWDTNGATAGAGTAGVANGAWTDDNWTTDANGEIATSAYVSGSDVVFSAGSDVTSATVSVTGTQLFNSMTFEEGSVTINSAALDDAGSGTIAFTVLDGASGVINNTDGVFNGTYDIQGSGSLTLNIARGGGISTKNGTGTLTVNRMDAILTVNAGLLIYTGTGDAKLKDTTINGGTLRLTGKAFDGTGRKVSIASGGELEIGAGLTSDTITLNGSSNSGTLDGGAGSRISINSGAFIGNVTGDLSITKVTTGTLTFGSGANSTTTGNITVSDGTFTLADGAAMTFYIGDDGVNNAILGTGAGVTRVANLNGAFNFDLSGADLTSGNSWLIVDVANLTSTSFSGTFAVNGFTEDNNIWTNGSGFSFSEATGVLSYTAVPEPAAAAMMAGLVMLAGASLRRRRNAN